MSVWGDVVGNMLYMMDTLKSDEPPYLSKLKNVFLEWKRRLDK